jgi:hypothetical protein
LLFDIDFNAPENPPDPVAELKSLLANILDGDQHLTKSRLDRLSKSVTPELLGRWNDVLASLPGDSGAMPRRVVAMWQEAVLLRMVPPIPALDRRINKKELTNFYREKKSFWVPLIQQRPNNVGPRVRAGDAEFGWMEGAWDRAHPLAGPLFELVWDVLYAQNVDQMDLALPDVRWWTIAGGSLDAKSSIIFPWPLIDLPIFSAYQHMAMRWNRTYPQATKLYARFPDEDSAADDLAYWYVDYHHVICHKKEWVPNWRTGVDKSRWTSAIDHLMDTTLKAPEDRPYVEWIRALPLLAAPESGLSFDAASAILAGANLDDTRCKDLRDFRLRRVRACLPDQDPQEALAKIDADYSEHPWIHLIEKRR